MLASQFASSYSVAPESETLPLRVYQSSCYLRYEYSTRRVLYFFLETLLSHIRCLGRRTATSQLACLVSGIASSWPICKPLRTIPISYLHDLGDSQNPVGFLYFVNWAHRRISHTRHSPGRYLQTILHDISSEISLIGSNIK